MTSTPVYESDVLFDEAVVAYERRQYTTASELFKKALDKRQAALQNSDDIKCGQIMDMLGLIQAHLNNLTEAENWFKKALEATEKATYAAHFKVGPILEHLVTLYMRQEKYQDAEPLCIRALDIFEKTLNGEHRCIYDMLHKLIIVYRKNGKEADAEKLIAKALKGIDSPLGPVEEFRFQQALIFANQGKDAEAENLLKQAISGFEQRRWYGRLTEALDTYAKLLTKSGKTAEAKRAEEYMERVKLATRHVKQHSDDFFSATLMRA